VPEPAGDGVGSVTAMSEVGIAVRRGSAADLHAADPFTDRTIAAPELWVCEPTGAAIVLGSRQTTALLDRAACGSAGVDIAHRRSGGGAVLVRPGAMCWIDVIVPNGFAPDDVRGSMIWIGDAWRDALIDLGGEPAALQVHRGDMVCTRWSELVCFAGLGPGEVVVDDRKLVGLSQRRTRHGIRVQCQVHRTPLLGEMPALFAGPTPDVAITEPALLGDVIEPDPGDWMLARALASALRDAGDTRITHP
jgi:lipoate-protein ligase A